MHSYLSNEFKNETCAWYVRLSAPPKARKQLPFGDGVEAAIYSRKPKVLDSILGKEYILLCAKFEAGLFISITREFMSKAKWHFTWGMIRPFSVFQEAAFETF